MTLEISSSSCKSWTSVKATWPSDQHSRSNTQYTHIYTSYHLFWPSFESVPFFLYSDDVVHGTTVSAVEGTDENEVKKLVYEVNADNAFSQIH